MSFLSIITYVGIFVFAITGALKARAYKMDIFGGLVVAFVTAYGGGTIRDLLIGVQPVNWINDRLAPWLVFGGTAITFLIKDHFNKFRRTIFFTDAIGLGLFTAAGIEVSLRNNVGDAYSLIMGVITATFGGMLGDIICNSLPTLLKRGELYATACAIGALIYILLKDAGLDRDVNLVVCILSVVAIRIYSKRKRLTLPDI